MRRAARSPGSPCAQRTTRRPPRSRRAFLRPSAKRARATVTRARIFASGAHRCVSTTRVFLLVFFRRLLLVVLAVLRIRPVGHVGHLVQALPELLEDPAEVGHARADTLDE